jgi:hypothetical protein
MSTPYRRTVIETTVYTEIVHADSLGEAWHKTLNVRTSIQIPGHDLVVESVVAKVTSIAFVTARGSLPVSKGPDAMALQLSADEARADERRQIINYLNATGINICIAAGAELDRLEHYKLEDPR